MQILFGAFTVVLILGLQALLLKFVTYAVTNRMVGIPTALATVLLGGLAQGVVSASAGCVTGPIGLGQWSWLAAWLVGFLAWSSVASSMLAVKLPEAMRISFVMSLVGLLVGLVLQVALIPFALLS